MPPRSKHRKPSKQTKAVAESAKPVKTKTIPQQSDFIPFLNYESIGHQTNAEAVIALDPDLECFALSLTVYSHGSCCNHKIALPERIEKQLRDGNRAIGKQVWIGSREHMFIVQYITMKEQCLRYLLVDLARNTVQDVEDKIGYFDKHYLSFGTGCHISPDFSWVLFRLPRNVLGNRTRFSKLPALDIESSEELGVKDKGLQDRYDVALAFNPLQPAEYITVLVNSYCRSCQISRQNLKPRHCELVKKQVVLPTESYKNSEAEEKSECCSPKQQGNVYLTLAQCSANFSRCGRWLLIALMCYRRSGTNTAATGSLLLHVIDTQTMEVIKTSLKALETFRFTLYLLPPVLDCSNEVASVWATNTLETRVHLGLSVKLPRILMALQELCRLALIRNGVCQSISKLPLPSRLKSFLAFDFIR